jgi:hypothetical protein
VKQCANGIEKSDSLAPPATSLTDICLRREYEILNLGMVFFRDSRCIGVLQVIRDVRFVTLVTQV